MSKKDLDNKLENYFFSLCCRLHLQKKLKNETYQFFYSKNKFFRHSRTNKHTKLIQKNLKMFLFKGEACPLKLRNNQILSLSKIFK
jgi:hypothetical protein